MGVEVGVGGSTAEATVGETVSIKTAGGPRRGKVEKVGDDGIAIVTTFRIGGQTGTTGYTVKWSQLAPEQREEFACRWRPGGPDGEIARAYVSLWDNDLDAAEKSMRAAGDHPLARHLAAEIAQARAGQAHARVLQKYLN